MSTDAQQLERAIDDDGRRQYRSRQQNCLWFSFGPISIRRLGRPDSCELPEVHRAVILAIDTAYRKAAIGYDGGHGSSHRVRESSRDVCRTANLSKLPMDAVDARRILKGEKLVSVEVALKSCERLATLNELIATPRISKSVGCRPFPVDSEEAKLAATWHTTDRRLLEASRFSVTVDFENVPCSSRGEPSTQGDESVLLQWVRDSAYRFFRTSRARGARSADQRTPSVRILATNKDPCSGGSSGSSP